LAVEDVDLHDLNWYVHVDLVTVAEDLAYWQAVLEGELDIANRLIEGRQGPVDTACCARMAGAASVAVFGTPGDGYDVIDSASKLNNLNSIFGGSGSNAYLVDGITYCGGPAPTSVGCAVQSNCSGNGNDDPNLWMIVTVESFETGTLPLVISHERGHNACLTHSNLNGCDVMQGTITNPGNGGCLSATECSNFRNGRTVSSSGLECGCHLSGGGIESDGQFCSGVMESYCSGGICDTAVTGASLVLLASAHPGSAGIPAPDDALRISTLTGDWVDVGQISPIAEDVHGMAFAKDSLTLYGVIPTSGNDTIVTIDRETGEIITAVGAIVNGAAELISMAYHPGLTSNPSDDRLIMLEVSAAGGAVVWIDPASPSVRNQYGLINIGPQSEFKGLAYDSIHGKLFAASPLAPGGLYEIDLTSCPPSPCNTTPVAGAEGLFVYNASLTFAPDTGMLYQVGTSFSGTRTFYNVIDPTNGESVHTLSVAEFTPGGLAVVPEPGVIHGLLIGCASLLWVRRRTR